MKKLYKVQEASEYLSKKEGRPISIYVVYYRASRRKAGRKYSETEILFDQKELEELAEERYAPNEEMRFARSLAGLQARNALREAGKIEPKSSEYYLVKKELVALFSYQGFDKNKKKAMAESFLEVAQAWHKKKSFLQKKEQSL